MADSKSTALRSACLQFVADALIRLSGRQKGPRYTYPSYPSVENWRLVDRAERRLERAESNWVHSGYDGILMHEWRAFRQSNGYRRIIDIVESSEDVSRRIFAAFEATYSSGSGGIEITGPQYTLLDMFLQYRLLEPYVELARSFELSQPHFEQAYAGFERTLIESSVEHRVYIPLRSMTLDRPIKLGDGLEVRELTPTEIESAVAEGYLEVLRESRTVAFLTSPTIAAVLRKGRHFTHDEIAAESFRTLFQQQVARRIDPGTSIDMLLAILNLVEDTACVSPCNGWTELTTSGTSTSRPTDVEHYLTPKNPPELIVSASQADQVVDMWTRLRRGTIKKRLNTAMLRYSSGVMRRSDQEAIAGQRQS